MVTGSLGCNRKVGITNVMIVQSNLLHSNFLNYDVTNNLPLQVGCAVIFNYFALLIGLSSFIVLDYYRVTAKMVDLICCIPGSICCCLVKDRETAELQNREIKPKKLEAEEGSRFSQLMDHFKQYSSPLTTLVVDFYSPFLKNYIVKAVIIVIFSIWFGVTVWGCTKVEDGLDIDDILPEGTVEHSYASANVEHFAAYSFTVVTKDINYSDREIQRSLLYMSGNVSEARYVLLAGGLTSNWLAIMTSYFSAIQRFYDFVYCPAFRANLITNPLEYMDIVGVMFRIHVVLNTSIDSMMLSQQVATCQPLPRLINDTDMDNPYVPSENFYQYVAMWVSNYE